MGNFNGQNSLWGIVSINKVLNSFLKYKSLILLNDKSPTRISSKASCSDLALCTSAIADKLRFKIGVDGFGSDYYPY